MSLLCCPPHHWWIESATASDIGEERWTCHRCGLVKLPHRLASPVETGELGLSNLSTVTREDLVVGGWEEALAS